MPRGNNSIGNLTKEQREAAVAKSKISRAKNKLLQSRGRFFEPGAKVSLMKRIRCKCLDCSNFQKLEIKLCSVVDCPLFEVRMGRRTMRAEATEKDVKELEEADLEIDEEEDELDSVEMENKDDFNKENNEMGKKEADKEADKNETDSEKDEGTNEQKEPNDFDDLEDIEL